MNKYNEQRKKIIEQLREQRRILKYYVGEEIDVLFIRGYISGVSDTGIEMHTSAYPEIIKEILKD